jgi:hypothetical protein
MDIGPFKTLCNTPSASIIGGHFPSGELGLGKFTPLKSNRVEILDSFVFNKTKGRVVKLSYRNRITEQ